MNESFSSTQTQKRATPMNLDTMRRAVRLVRRKDPPGEGADPQRLKLELKRLRPTGQMNPPPQAQRGRGLRHHNASQCPCYLAGMSGKHSPQVNRTEEDEAIHLGIRHGMKNGLGALMPRPKDRIHHAHHRNMTTGHLRHGGITATMRRSESSV